MDGPEGAPAREPERQSAPIPMVEAGPLAVRLAVDPADIDAAQALRFRVFYEEMAAKASPDVVRARRDVDEFDAVCDHLLVIDSRRADDETGGVVGTYRVLRRSQAEAFGRFYSASEYDIGPLVSYRGEILELGRSCVDAAYRNGPTMQLLWRFIAAYVYHYDIEIMFGCASLPGTDVAALTLPLAYLHHFHLAPPALRPRALAERYVSMDQIAADKVDRKAALAKLPPLIKGYLRLGGFVGDGAVIDHQFNTTDVSIVVKTDLVTEKYIRHYERAREATA
jgi:L-ornithine Nalpha-acyltransferase